MALRLKCGGGKVMPVDVEHAHTLARGVTASVQKGKVRKWSAKQADARHHKRHCSRANSSGQLAGTTAVVSQSAHAPTDEGHECGKQLK